MWEFRRDPRGLTKEEKCKLSVGMRYAREPVQQKLHLMYLATTRFAIPPFAPAHAVSVTREMPCDAIGVGMFVHKVKQNPAMAVAKLLTAANPDVEVLSADRDGS